MRYNWKRMLATAMALLLIALPVLGAAEADFDAGTLFNTLYEENYAGGRLIETTIRAKVDQITGASAEDVALAQKVLDLFELRVSALDDIDQQYTTVTLMLGGGVMVQALIKTDATGAYLVSEQLPGVTLRLPGNMAPSAQSSADMEALQNAYIDYFAIVAAWVSQKQVDREDLYVYEPVEIDESEVRDASALEMRCRVRPDDLKELLRMLADQFYNDNATQEAVTNLLASRGVTRADVRRIADQLPLWVSHELISTGDATDFVISYDDDMNIVGFDGKMPALYEKYPFKKGDLTYSRKTMEEGSAHRAKGTMEMQDGGKLAGELQAFIGDLFEDARKDEFTLSLAYTGAKGAGDVAVDIVTQNQYLAAADLDTYDGLGKFDVVESGGAAGDKLHGEYTIHSETKPVGELDFVCETTVQIDITDQLSMTVECVTASKEATPVTFPANEKQFDLEHLTESQRTELLGLLQEAAMPLMLKLMGKLPPELTQKIMAN